jgi:protein-S-isoprenylcysteine O-methyltransferase Ste14
MEQKRKVIPPVYFFLALVLMAALHWMLPLARLLAPPLTYVVGIPLIVAGMWLGGHAFRGFSKAGTPVVPFERSTTLVTNGSYRLTRNPMYVGMVMILAGIAALLGTLGPWLPIPFFVWIIRSNFIIGEERFLEELFGQQYLAYKSRVRRWL